MAELMLSIPIMHLYETEQRDFSYYEKTPDPHQEFFIG